MQTAEFWISDCFIDNLWRSNDGHKAEAGIETLGCITAVMHPRQRLDENSFYFGLKPKLL
jgi:hypothetical protein